MRPLHQKHSRHQRGGNLERHQTVLGPSTVTQVGLARIDNRFQGHLSRFATSQDAFHNLEMTTIPRLSGQHRFQLLVRLIPHSPLSEKQWKSKVAMAMLHQQEVLPQCSGHRWATCPTKGRPSRFLRALVQSGRHLQLDSQLHRYEAASTEEPLQ
jgi:hypothetical protein